MLIKLKRNKIVFIKYFLIIFFLPAINLHAQDNCQLYGEIFLKLERGMDLLSGTEIFILEEKDYKKANEFYNNKIQTYINDYENQKSKYRNDYENQKTKHQNEKTALDHRISEINAPMEEISKKINNLRLTRFCIKLSVN